MNSTRVLSALLITGLWLGAVAVPRAEDGLTDVVFEPAAFDPVQGEQAVIRFQSNRSGQAIIRLFGPDWHQVRELAIEGIEPEGPASVAWDGRDDEGNLVPAEVYFPVIELTDRKGEVRTIDPTLGPRPGQVFVEDLRFDPERGAVTYSLQAPARVTLLAGISDGGPLLRTLVADAPRRAGPHHEPWDGMDADGVVDVPAQPGFRLYAEGVGVWQPSVAVTSGSDESYFQYRRRVESRLVKQRPDIRVIGGTPAALPKPVDMTPEPRFDLSVSGTPDEDGLPVVSGRVLVQVALEESVRIPVIERRFEIVLFVDQRFVTEVEDGRSPATVIWDSTQVSDGEHLLTVNVATLPGQISAASLRVRVRNNP
ncbi:MAG: hypothetical protein N838_19825 [Thiohalocapsa sp. PB-PSB1]|jgi:hypothetical protein|nr:MAG: hypothetical protein N838_18375 [Thiohalocapsa sp. PB-PSB1]QQO55260.1 MAG: hypothetical protein N838_19825 [Thiohalocapsa sp. PB-PSB1]HCS92295.1 hypothetical protein [Chromatiaceae bacterium]